MVNKLTVSVTGPSGALGKTQAAAPPAAALEVTPEFVLGAKAHLLTLEVHPADGSPPKRTLVSITAEGKISLKRLDEPKDTESAESTESTESAATE